MNHVDWQGCYDGSLKDLVTKESMAHPAKFARGLIERIYDYGEDMGYWTPRVSLLVDQNLLEYLVCQNILRLVSSAENPHKESGVSSATTGESPNLTQSAGELQSNAPSAGSRLVLREDSIENSVQPSAPTTITPSTKTVQGNVYALCAALGLGLARPANENTVPPNASKQHSKETATQKTKAQTVARSEKETHELRGPIAGIGVAAKSGTTEQSGMKFPRNSGLEENAPTAGREDSYKSTTSSLTNMADTINESFLFRYVLGVTKTLTTILQNCSTSSKKITLGAFLSNSQTVSLLIPQSLRVGDTIHIQESVVCDPFGGVGVGGVVGSLRGYVWRGCELEPRFVEMAEANFAMHAAYLKERGLPQPIIVQGDSRKIDEIMAGVLYDGSVTSPPFAGNSGGTGEKSSKPMNDKYPGVFERHLGSMNNKSAYGAEEGQINNMPQGGVDKKSLSLYNTGHEAIRNKHVSGLQKRVVSSGYMRETQGVSRVCRVPLQEERVTDALPLRGVQDGVQVGKAEGDGQVGSGALSLEGRQGQSSLSEDCQKGDLRNLRLSPEFVYSSQGLRPFQRQPHKSSSAMCLVSPPTPQEGLVGGQESGEGIQEQCASGMGVDGCVTSPPYAETRLDSGPWKGEPGPRFEEYGETEGQLGNLADAAVTSPPFGERLAYPDVERGKEVQRKLGKSGTLHQSPGESEGQIAQLDSSVQDNIENNIEIEETYWTAVAQIYAGVFVLLKPGGVLSVVLKNYVKNGAVVPFVETTAKVLEGIGFEIVDEIHAMQVKDTGQIDMFSGETKKISRKSFFRRLHERRRPDLAIDYEVVLFCRKP